MKHMILLIAVILAVFFSGCATLRPGERKVCSTDYLGSTHCYKKVPAKPFIRTGADGTIYKGTGKCVDTVLLPNGMVRYLTILCPNTLTVTLAD